ncbi:uncharacterized protein LOC129720370 [Wyeomyia smithii]|uniref:uncharacterized protein LOC129720370 n=1 Tax=Wyeomyia smithii TaxID=174621 RepID=UPI002467D9E9|nr:uncharacterized protein LOC129720370 [Wyeomyia smithii]
MKFPLIQVFLVVVAATAASADIGEFFDNLFSVFKPSGNETDSSVEEVGNTTVSPVNYNVTEHTTNVVTVLNETVVTHSPVEVFNSSIHSNVTTTEPVGLTLNSSTSSPKEDFFENSTIDIEYAKTLNESTTEKLNTTTVVYKLFHPNTTTTTEATTATNSTENTTAPIVGTPTLTLHNSSEVIPSAAKRDASLTITESALPVTGSSIAPPLASYKLSAGVTCSFSVNKDTNSIVVSCGSDSATNVTNSNATSTTPAHTIKRRSVEVIELPHGILAYEEDGSGSFSGDSFGESTES